MKMCRTCETFKPLSEFYTHEKMADGHLNKCKDCVKYRVKSHRVANIDRIQANDRRRGWTEERKERARDNAHKYAHKRTDYVRKHRAKHPEAYRARTAVGNAIRDGKLVRQSCEVCGDKAHAHHEDYSEPLEVRWLCAKHHGLVHRKAA